MAVLGAELMRKNKLLLPEGWKQVPLGELAEVRTGLSKNAKREGPTVKRPYLRVANVQDGSLDLSDVQEIDVPISQVSRFTLKKNDLLLIEGNGNPENLGRGSLWDGQISDAVHQNHVFAVRTHSEKLLLPKFLELQIQSDYGKSYFLSCAKGSTGLSSLNSTQLKEFPLLLPPVVEQHSIAEVVVNWSTAIEKTERLVNSKQLHYAHELSRLMSLSSHPRRHISTFAAEVSERNRLGNQRVLSVTNTRGFVLPEDQFERRIASADLSNYKVVSRRQFAYNPSRINVGSIARLDGWDDGVLSPMYVVFKLNETIIDSDYFGHWLASHEARQRIKNSAQGSVRETVSFGEFAAVLFPFPEKKRQSSIAAYLNCLRDEIGLLQIQAEKLRLQKRGLVERLLTGKLRVSADDEAAA